MEDKKCSLVFHWCHFGEAHPLFLRALREATEGMIIYGARNKIVICLTGSKLVSILKKKIPSFRVNLFSKVIFMLLLKYKDLKKKCLLMLWLQFQNVL
jgi:hypothetical protein